MNGETNTSIQLEVDSREWEGGLIQVFKQIADDGGDYFKCSCEGETTSSFQVDIREGREIDSSIQVDSREGGANSSIQVDNRGRRGLLQEESREWRSYFNQVFKQTDKKRGDYFKQTAVKGGLIQVFKQIVEDGGAYFKKRAVNGEATSIKFLNRKTRRKGTTSSRQLLRGANSSIQVDSRGDRGLLQVDSRKGWEDELLQVDSLCTSI